MTSPFVFGIPEIGGLPDFVAKTQNSSVPDPRFDEFTVPLLDDLWAVIRMNSCSALSELSGSI